MKKKRLKAELWRADWQAWVIIWMALAVTMLAGFCALSLVR